MEYTKGEWKVEIIDSSFPKRHKVYARINPSVGYVGWDSMGVYDDPGVGKRELKTLSSEALANAYLIAAAPDMYEALKSFVASWEKGDIEMSYETRSLTKKAIAKAEGK